MSHQQVSVYCAINAKKSHHLNCVNIDTHEETFTCDNCANRAPFSGSPRSTRSHHRKASSTSKSSSIRMKNLERQRLEEERQLAKDERSREITYLIRHYNPSVNITIQFLTPSTSDGTYCRLRTEDLILILKCFCQKSAEKKSPCSR